MSYSKPSKRKRVDFPINEQTQSMESTDVIDLNVGGHYVTTTRDTIRKHKSNLEQMIEDPKKDKDGRIFIEFDYEIFKHVLEFLKRDTLPPKSMAMKVYNYAKELELTALQSKLEWFSSVKLRLDFEKANDNRKGDKLVNEIVTQLNSGQGLYVHMSGNNFIQNNDLPNEVYSINPFLWKKCTMYIAYCLHELGYVVFYMKNLNISLKVSDDFLVFRSGREYWQAYFRDRGLDLILVDD